MSRLEELCRPYLALVCSRGNYARSGVPVDPKALKDELHDVLADIRAKCEDDPLLRREFERVEKPLAFFADYCLKESDTGLGSGWTDLGREYNELSGDEKFYDLLSATLEDPEASERLRLFYLMLGLGFEGVHRGDEEFVQRRMKLCAARFQVLDNPEVKVRPDVTTPYSSLFRRPRALAACLISAVALAAGALAFNYYRFCSETNSYRAALQSARSFADATDVSDTPSALEKEARQ